MSTQFPLDAYLARLDWTSAARPVADAPTLDALVLAHTMAIPFENLDPLRRKPVAVDSETVAAKLIDARRGGFCFEHGRLFADALRALGYPVRELAARVMWMQPDDALTPQSHMLLDVGTPDGARLVDVGFGGLTVTAGLRWEDGLEQRTPHGAYRLLRRDDYWWLQSQIADEWKNMYRVRRIDMHGCDYEASSYFLSTHPQSIFTGNLMLARAGVDRRWTLFNRDLSEYRADGSVARRTLADGDALIATVQDLFGLPVADQPDLLTPLRALAAD
ncbi:arylamine N-acetyltransferase [Methyloversatilis discipulorum]|uniref:arylamine N-acetyltransferase family protein n=1 Tax=Methyloversatilis discipulorum TaxID=1119528 RepID=UPI00313779F0